MAPAIALAVLAAAVLCTAARAADWPAYMHDNRRSARTSERLDVPMQECWVYTARHRPRPAWPPPAKADFFHHKRDLNPRMIFDRAYQPVIAGGFVYFGSSADDKVYALDTATGEEEWSFFTDGPVRLAPAAAGGRLYVGSDDGFVYCLDGANGRLIWKQRVAARNESVLGNDRMISLFPVRAGVLVADGAVYACAGLFPRQGVWNAAFDADSGALLWRNPQNVSPQGYMLASSERIYTPTGRTSPVVFDPRDGKLLGSCKGPVGAYALVADDIVVYGPGDKGELGVTETATRDHIATFPGLRMIVHEGRSYLHSKTSLSAIDRVRYLDLVRERRKLGAQAKGIEKQIKELGEGSADTPKGRKLAAELDGVKQAMAACAAAMPGCTLWEQPCRHPLALIMAGDVLFAGGEKSVAAFSTTDGRLLWTGVVAGRAYGLAAAGGKLFISTDKGTIHCLEAR